MQIGGDSIYGQFFAGLIDEVRVYNVALTAAQIQTDEATSIGGGPTAPGSLTATAVSGSEVDLSWAASTDTNGVTGYQVERCQGVGCTNFAQIVMPTGTSYNDTTVIRQQHLPVPRSRGGLAGQARSVLERRDRIDRTWRSHRAQRSSPSQGPSSLPLLALAAGR